MKRLFIVLIKYIPIIQMIGMLFNNILYCFSDIISSLTKLNRGIKRISKREACERILHCSPSSFDNYIKLGLIPRGHKEYGFKELSWSEKDFDKATLARIKKYRDKQGL